LITGAAGFVGSRVVGALLGRGFSHLRCLVRPSSNMRLVEPLLAQYPQAQVEIVKGNLLSPADCARAAAGVSVIYHLAAGTASKSVPDAFMNSVVATRNLAEAALASGTLRRFVSLSSFAVYSNRNNPKGKLLDETAPVEDRPESRAEAYCYAKVKQDELVIDYGRRRGLPWVLIRPGVVYGPGKKSISGRVGIDTFGFFLHFGGSNQIPLTYVENCADAIVLAGLKPGIEGEVFNVVDDDLPSSRKFLRLYKRNVRRFKSIYVPKPLSYLFCWAWEKYSAWSAGQLPPVFTRAEWTAFWKPTRYTNRKLKTLLGWAPRTSMAEGLERFFQACADNRKHA
jgi:nucleoside-diphosphate-sugar epimerase